MKIIKYLVLILIVGLFTFCKKAEPTQTNSTNGIAVKPSAVVTTITEDFETGGKSAYAAANVTLTTGSWNLSDALTGNTSADVKNGSWSARVRNSGVLSMNFDKSNGASTITVKHALYGTDGNGTWGLWYSTNSGSTYTQSGSSVTTSSSTLTTQTFTLNVSGSIRIQVRKTDGGTNRINFDDITINDYTVTSNPVPTLTSISPSSVTVGSSATTVTCTGTNFVSGSVVKINGTALTTTYVSATSVTASIPSTYFASAGVDSISVYNPAPGGGTSAAKVLTVSALPAPTLTSISPASCSAGASTFTLTATGTNFTSTSTINWNGTALTTTFGSSTSLTASIAASLVTTAGTASVTVTNATGTSSAQTFTINGVAPVLSGISPSSCTAGASAFTLTATGTNITSGTSIKWNGTALTTTFGSSTSLSASISSSLVTSAGTASVTVSNTFGTSSAQTFTINSASTTKKILFDNTKAETAGNADWVIDEDGGSAARYPTPAQSGITSSTSETYWTGGISSWGVKLVKLGYSVESLPSSGSITYGNSSNSQDLSNYNVFVIDEPNTLFTSSEKTAIINFVKNGGGLFIICDHNGSDRNNDGYDSRAVLNDLFTNNSVATNPFGMSIDATSFSQTSTNVLSSSTDPIINGSQGTVSSLQFSSGASITTSTSANSSVQGLIWKNSVTQNSTNVMAAYATYGSGRVVLVADSSPADDGTGSSGHTLYNGWGVGSSAALHLNGTIWLAK